MALTPCPVSRLLRTIDEFEEIPNTDVNGVPIGGSLWREKATGKVFTARDHPSGGTISSTTAPQAETAHVLEVPDERQVECAICMSRLQRAMTLVPCGHSFCAHCIKLQIQTGGIHCGYCRKPFEQCIPNYALRQTVEEHENSLEGAESEAWLLARPSGNRVVARDALVREAWLLTLYRVAFNVQTPDAYLCVMPVEIRGGSEPRLHLLLSREHDYCPLESPFADIYRAHVRAHGQEPFTTISSKGERIPIAGLGTLLAAAILLDDHHVLSSAGYNDTGRIVKLAVGEKAMPAAQDSPLLMTDLSDVERKCFIQTLLHAFQELRPHVLQEWHAGAVPDDTPAVGVTRSGLADISNRIMKRLSNTVGLYAHVLDQAVVTEWETQVDLIAREIVDDPQVALRANADVENLESQFASLRGFVTQEAVALRVAQINESVSSTFQVPVEPNMIGRSTELLTLHRSLKASGGSVISQAIAGMGGIGKTTLAAKYCSIAAKGGYIEGERLSYSHVAWLRAENGSELKAQLAALLKLWVNMTVPHDAEVGDIFWESLRGQSWKVLLVFDNIPTLELLSDLLPSVNASRPCTCYIYIIATTRDVTQHSSSLQLETFTLADTTHFVAAHFDGPVDDALVKQIHETMAGLPLALIQTAAYVRTTGNSLADTLLLFAASKSELLFYGTLADGTHPRTIGTLVSLAIAHLHTIDELAVDVLACAAYFPPERTRKFFYREALHADIDASAATLQSLGVIKLSADTISIHRLVQVCVRQKLSNRGRAAVEAYLCGRDQESPSGGVHEIVRITEFFLSLTHQPSSATARIARWTRYLCERYLGDHGRARVQAIYALRVALGADVTVGVETLFAIAETRLREPGVLDNLCHVLAYGADAAWLILVDRLLAITEQEFPEAVVDVLNRGASLAYNVNEYNLALSYSMREMVEKEKQNAHPLKRALTSLNQGVLLSKMGRPTEGEPLQDAAIRVLEDTYGRHSPPVASALALMLHTRSNAAQQNIRERIIEIRETSEGEYDGHIDDLDNLAATYADNGEFVKACAVHERVLALREESVGEDSAELLLQLKELAKQYGNAKQWTDVLRIRLRILTFKERTGILAEVAIAQINVGRVYWRTGDRVKAIEYFEKALTTREAYLGADHELICDILQEIGSACYDADVFQRALECRQRAVDISDRLSIPDRLLVHLTDLGRTFLAVARYEDARGVFVRALKLAQGVHKTPHVEISNSRSWLALCYCNMTDEGGEYDLHVSMSLDAVFEDKLEKAKHCSHFAVVCGHRGDMQKARETFSNALRLFQEHYKSDFPKAMIHERLTKHTHPNTRKRDYFIGLAQASAERYGQDHPTTIALRAAAEDIAIYPLAQGDTTQCMTLPWTPGRDTVSNPSKFAFATNSSSRDAVDSKSKFVFSTKWSTGKK